MKDPAPKEKKKQKKQKQKKIKGIQSFACNETLHSNSEPGTKAAKVKH
jgi:hypothetical protein